MQFSDYVTAGGLFILSACLPAGIWIILLIVGAPGTTLLSSIGAMLSAENLLRGFFIFLAVSSAFSFVAGTLLLTRRPSRLALKILLAGGIAQCRAYLAWTALVPAAVSATPLFWLRRAYKKANRSIQSGRESARR
jgi:hypothetical protein